MPSASALTPSTSSEPKNVMSSAVRALVLYSLAEFQLGHASTIRVTSRGHSFSVEDDGRGHAITRTVDGAPYLKFIYGHLDYPFEAGEAKTIQLQGIGMSLLNSLCTELNVTVRKQDATLRMVFQHGCLLSHEVSDAASEQTGNVVSGEVNTGIESRAVDEQALEGWLRGIVATSPTLHLYFNGQELGPRPLGDA
jgi:DNA gyrase/topoisomerase IV subunit B